MLTVNRSDYILPKPIRSDPVGAYSPLGTLSCAVRQALRTSGVLPVAIVAAALAGYIPAAVAGPFPAEIELSSLLVANGGDGSAGFVLNGIDEGDISGRSVSAAGDVNGDGIGDVIVGAPGADPGGRAVAGESYIVFGRSDNEDTDGDGIINDADNCLLEPNADQRDTNSDGFGNLCDADFNGDCVVNFIDLGEFKQNFLMPGDTDYDLDGDGAVDFSDLGIVKEAFFRIPGPSGPPNACDP